MSAVTKRGRLDCARPAPSRLRLSLIEACLREALVVGQNESALKTKPSLREPQRLPETLLGVGRVVRDGAGHRVEAPGLNRILDKSLRSVAHQQVEAAEMPA